MTAAEAYEIIGIMANGQRGRELGYDGLGVQVSYGDFIRSFPPFQTKGRTNSGQLITVRGFTGSLNGSKRKRARISVAVALGDECRRRADAE
jgi:hypothetical protein